MYRRQHINENKKHVYNVDSRIVCQAENRKTHRIKSNTITLWVTLKTKTYKLIDDVINGYDLGAQN